MAYDTADDRISAPAVELIADGRARAAIFDMNSPAGRAGAGRMLARMGRTAVVQAAQAARLRDERARRLAALRRAQARIGPRLLSGEEWAREIETELAAMTAEDARDGAQA